MNSHVSASVLAHSLCKALYPFTCNLKIEKGLCWMISAKKIYITDFTGHETCRGGRQVYFSINHPKFTTVYSLMLINFINAIESCKKQLCFPGEFLVSVFADISAAKVKTSSSSKLLTLYGFWWNIISEQTFYLWCIWPRAK